MSSRLIPDQEIDIYTQGIMDLGSIVCKIKKPQCQICPVKDYCYAFNYSVITNNEKKREIKNKTINKYIILIMKNKNDFFMVKKKSKGFWSDLWLFPMLKCSNDEEVEIKINKLKKRLSIKKVGKIKHFLSHLTISANIVSFDVTKKENQQKQSRWVSRTKALGMGIPKLVNKILIKYYF